MTSSKINQHPNFVQDEYTNSFYCCEKDHPFIAFTTCYCPMCDAVASISILEAEVLEAETSLDRQAEVYYTLVAKVNNTNPELLI